MKKIGFNWVESAESIEVLFREGVLEYLKEAKEEEREGEVIQSRMFEVECTIDENIDRDTLIFVVGGLSVGLLLLICLLWYCCAHKKELQRYIALKSQRNVRITEMAQKTIAVDID